MSRKSLRKRFFAVLLTAAAALLYNAAQSAGDAGDENYAGLPKARSYAPKTWVRVLHNEGFVIGYSEIRRDPLWVIYRAHRITRQHHYSRPERFEVDLRTLSHVTPVDYNNSGYERGHMAPNYIISELYGPKAQHQTFLMSNITPQRPRLNEKLWQRLEEAEADYFTHWFDSLWVTTGPVFGDHIEQLKDGVEVPDAFYRIFAGLDTDGTPHLIAFLMPQEVRGDEPLEGFVTTVDDIEARTGLDFFSALPDDQEESLESSPADSRWTRLKEVSRLPSRY